jgi:Mn2+/Fe2+ NRAMP family transporter
VAETFRWRASLESTPRQAPRFYLVLSAAVVIGISLNFFGIDPIRALYWSAVVNGIVAVPLMFILMLMSTKRAVIGEFALPGYLRVVGWFATGVMLLASLGFLATAIHGKP